jgi:hypothetical protein
MGTSGGDRTGSGMKLIGGAKALTGDMGGKRAGRAGISS